MNRFQKALIEAGITNEFLLEKTEELIDAIKYGTYKPKNKEKKLKELNEMKVELIYRVRKGER